ncbi:energy transducer TonB [Acinetobacter qingfengensis]|uniref:TonB C-terminal domain-containing protein n=1 Tax=Acinetobacter qingfengensis TaxID=1262585 RepID=A0A1E7RCV1_9GAMM|nr:energy transducer TonB [Acinetobacter qingfengensis]KAA8732115.1 energy transducer TonB [Acinetobacter qingfengensis]OEY97194.1 hypothetical protein BJI46_01850 [Acinetobacter qingfengensis]
MDLVYRNRHVISYLPAILIGAYLLVLSQTEILHVDSKYEDKAIEISLAEPIPEPTPPEPQPQPEPQPVATPEPPPVEPENAIEQVDKPRVEKKVEAKKLEPKKVEAQKTTSVKEQIKTETKQEPQPQAKTEVKAEQKPAPEVKKPEPAKPAASANSASVEAAYSAKVRSTVEAQKRYPTGREASLERPEGNVEVWLEIDRSGRVLNSGIASKAKSMLLNRAATNSLKSIKQVAPFPADAFSGANSKRFTATLVYQAP